MSDLASNFNIMTITRQFSRPRAAGTKKLNKKKSSKNETSFGAFETSFRAALNPINIMKILIFNRKTFLVQELRSQSPD